MSKAPPLNYRNDDPVEEVPRFPRSWASAIITAVLLAAAAFLYLLLTDRPMLP